MEPTQMHTEPPLLLPQPLTLPPSPAPPPCKLLRAPFETALHHAGSGRFQRLLLCACGAVYAACAVSTTTLSFVLPSAECDFRLTSADKGRLNATPLLGMCVGSYVWGALADARGRKWAIISALLLDAAAALVSSFANTFTFFLCCRFFSGFGIIGATGLVFPYFGDFLTLRHRDVMLCRLEVFWVLGTILLPGIAWGIIPQRVFSLGSVGGVPYASWRTFVCVCGLPSLLVAGMLARFPESPRFLLHAHRAPGALAVLQLIYSANTGHPAHSFPVESMVAEDEEGACGAAVGSECGVGRTAAADTMTSSTASKSSLTWHQRTHEFWRRKRVLFSEKYLGLLALCCFVDFGLMFSYYTLMLWFPDLFERFAQHTGVDAGVCEVSADFSAKLENLSTGGCMGAGGVRWQVYAHTLAVALSCLPTALALGLVINRIGKKIMLVGMLVSSGAAALGLTLVQSSLQTVALSCAFESVVSCTEAVLFCVICEIFPTSVAGTATAVTVTCGRVGAIVGNVVFGALLDHNCRVPIYMFGGLLISSGLLCSVVPESPRPPHPAAGTDLPAAGTDLPAAGTDLPAAGTDLPAAGTDLPAAGTDLPAAGTDLPAAGTHLPAAGTDLPPAAPQTPPG